MLQPLCAIEADPMPDGKVRSRKKPLPWLTNRVKVSRTRSVRKMSGQPSSSKSLKSQPMPETMAPDSLARDAGLEGHLGEACPSGVVAVQEVGHPVVGDEDVHAAVAVVVGDGDSHPLAEGAVEADLVGDVGEGPVAVVAQEHVRQGLEDVRIAVDAVPALLPAAPVVALFSAKVHWK